MVSSSQIREHLSLLLDHQIGLDSFEDWFVQNTWNIHQSGSMAAESLTFAIEESLSEYSSEHINDDELRAELFGILQSDNMIIVIASPMTAPPKVIWSARKSVPLVLAASV